MSDLPADSAARAAVAEGLAATHALVFPAPQVWAARDFLGLFDTRGILLTGDAESFVLGRVLFGEAEILTLATHPAHQRQGRARAALAAFTQQAQACGAETIFLEVSLRNNAATSLYAAAGYVQVGRRAAYYLEADGTRSDAMVMSRGLAA